MAGELTEPCGLGAAAQQLPLYVPSYRGFTYDGIASFSPGHARDYFSPDTIYGFDPQHVSVQQFTCVIKTLDSLELAPSFIKIDVEGFEHEVLRGGLDTLRRHEPTLLFERTWVGEGVFTTLAGVGYEEVVLRDGRIVRGRSGHDNATMMTARRLAECV